MAIGSSTPRDQLDRILNVVRRAFRYWWLVAAFVVIGGALSVLFALSRPHVYESNAILFHQERISTSLLRGREVELATRNLGDRYSDILLARSNLRTVVEEFELHKGDVEEGIEELKLLVKFRARGAGTFSIAYQDTKPERAQKVTQRLTEILIAEDSRIRQDQASVTVNFLLSQKDRAEEALRKRERELNSFLADHPEFVADEQGGSAGAGIRAAQRGSATPSTGGITDDRLLALVRQRNRLKASLDAPDNPTPRPTRRTPEQIAAERVVETARGELTAAQRELQARQARFTERHPDVIEAKARVSEAQRALRRAQAAVPANEPVAPVRTVDKAQLRTDLAEIERQITARRAYLKKQNADKDEPKTEPVDEENWVVALESEFARLSRLVTESRERVDTLDGRVFTAEINASSQMAEQGAQLAVIDEAHKPVHPVGKGKKLLVMAGLLLFGGLGTAVALGMALIDDRVYSRMELENLDITPVLVEIPAPAKKTKGKAAVG